MARSGRQALGATQRFGPELLELLVDTEYVTASGRPNLAAFAEQLDGVRYETLRRAVRGKARPSLALLTESARVLQMLPAHFLEYRLARVAQQLDVDVGVSDVLRVLRRLESGDELETEDGLSEPFDDPLNDARPLSPDVAAAVEAVIIKSIAAHGSRW